MTLKTILESIVTSNNLSLRELGLRLDRVALRLLNDLETSCKKHVPQGQTLIITVTAPIKLPA